MKVVRTAQIGASSKKQGFFQNEGWNPDLRAKSNVFFRNEGFWDSKATFFSEMKVAWSKKQRFF